MVKQEHLSASSGVRGLNKTIKRNTKLFRLTNVLVLGVKHDERRRPETATSSS